MGILISGCYHFVPQFWYWMITSNIPNHILQEYSQHTSCILIKTMEEKSSCWQEERGRSAAHPPTFSLQILLTYPGGQAQLLLVSGEKVEEITPFFPRRWGPSSPCPYACEPFHSASHWNEFKLLVSNNAVIQRGLAVRNPLLDVLCLEHVFKIEIFKNNLNLWLTWKDFQRIQRYS